MFTSAQLKTGLQTDPAGLGYAPLVAAHDAIGLAGLLNDTTKGGTIIRATVTAADLQGCVVPAEYAALSAVQQNAWSAILVAAAGNGVPVSNANIRAQVTAIWGAATTTRANCAALQSRPGSRAEALWGDGTVVTDLDVRQVLWNADGTPGM